MNYNKMDDVYTSSKDELVKLLDNPIDSTLVMPHLQYAITTRLSQIYDLQLKLSSIEHSFESSNYEMVAVVEKSEIADYISSFFIVLNAYCFNSETGLIELDEQRVMIFRLRNSKDK